MWRKGPLCSPVPEGVHKKVFFLAGKLDICHYSVEKVHVLQLQRVGSHGCIMPKIQTVKRLRATR